MYIGFRYFQYREGSLQASVRATEIMDPRFNVLGVPTCAKYFSKANLKLHRASAQRKLEAALPKDV